MKSANSVFCLQLNRIKDLNRLFTSKNGARPFLQVAISNSEMSNACRLVAPSALRVNLYLRCNSGRGLKPRAQACFCGLGSASPRRTGFCDKCSQPNQTEPAQRRACIQTRTAPFRAGAMEHRDRVTPEYGHAVPLQNAAARVIALAHRRRGPSLCRRYPSRFACARRARSHCGPPPSRWRGYIYPITPPAPAASRRAAHARPGPGQRP